MRGAGGGGLYIYIVTMTTVTWDLDYWGNIRKNNDYNFNSVRFVTAKVHVKGDLTPTNSRTRDNWVFIFILSRTFTIQIPQSNNILAKHITYLVINHIHKQIIL